MKTAQPIRDVKTINQIKEILKARHDKYYMRRIRIISLLQSTLLCGANQTRQTYMIELIKVSIHAPMRSESLDLTFNVNHVDVSIHAPMRSESYRIL